MDDHHVPLGLPSKVLWSLTDHMGEGYFGPKSEAKICELIRHWIATTPAMPFIYDDEDEEGVEYQAELQAGIGPVAEALQTLSPLASPVVDTSRGYQWKQLFLPNGTELRTIYCGRSLYAKVENEQIISDGLPTTPSRLANAQGCGTRNAWKTIWLRFPDAKRWELAARCRDAER